MIVKTISIYLNCLLKKNRQYFIFILNCINRIKSVRFDVLHENNVEIISDPYQHSVIPHSRNASLKLRKYAGSTANKEDIVRHASDEMRQR